MFYKGMRDFLLGILMGASQTITRIQMLRMIGAKYENDYCRLLIGNLVALDGLLLKPWVIDGKVDPLNWRKFGVVCFEEGRQKTQVLTALIIGDRNYHFSEYELWCVPSTLKDATFVVSKLPMDLREKTLIHDLSKYYSTSPTKPLFFAAQTISQDKDSTLYWDVKEYVDQYGYTLVWVSDEVKERIDRIFQLLNGEDYIIEEVMRQGNRVLYRVQKPPAYDLDLSQIGHLSEEKWKALESKMLENHFVIVKYSGHTDHDKTIFKEWITAMLEKLAKEPIVASKTSQTVIGGETPELWWQIQKAVTDEYLARGLKIDYSFERGYADIIVYDDQGKVVEVVAIKSYSIEVRTKKGQRNVKGTKYVASFKADRDAIAEVKTAKKNNLDKIRLICFNLNTRRRIYDDLVSLDKPVTIDEKSEEYKKRLAKKQSET